MDKDRVASDTLLSRNEIPIIDLSNLESVTNKSWVEHLTLEISNALSTKGFALLINHGISKETLSSVNNKMRQFCDLPDDVKELYKLQSEQEFYGYVPPGKENLYNDEKVEVKHSFNVLRTSQPLPTLEIDDIQEVIDGVVEEHVKLSEFLLKIIADSIGFDSDMFLRAHKGIMNEDNHSVFRMLYYPPIEDESLANITRCGAHTDYGTMTLLTQDCEGGLEIFFNGEWRRVGHLPGAVLMILGEMMEIWCASKYKAVRHRVVIPEEGQHKGRYSTAFFALPDNNTSIGPSVFIPEDRAGDDATKGGGETLNALEFLENKLAAIIVNKTNNVS